MRRIFLSFLLCSVSILYVAGASMLLADLRCENLTNPMGIDNTVPHFSWKILARGASMNQRFYEIQVGTDSVRLCQGKADLWNTGMVRSDASVMVPYQGLSLKSRMLCYWRVRVADERGEWSEWSAVQRFAIGVIEEEGDSLRGKFISLKGKNISAPLLRKKFKIDAISTTFLHVASLGYHEAYINGRKVDASVLGPAVSQLDKRCLIVTYDVTPLLKPGDNELLLWLGKGWYKANTFKAEHDGPVVKAELAVLGENGTWNASLVTDDTWKGRESGYIDTGSWNALHFGGERIDGRILPLALTAEELDNLSWEAVYEVNVLSRKSTPQMCEPNKIQEILSPKSITSLGNDTWLVDMGKVLTGWFELKTPQMPEGHELTVVYSDFMKSDGTIEEQGESDIYITSGRQGDVFCNKFHSHAFRYVKISHLPYRPQPAHIRAYLIHGDYQPASTFMCSDGDLNAIHDMINYTLRCLTFSGYMVDCPHLERTGYGGDGNSSAQIFQTMYDAAPTYINWLQAWKDVIQEDGGLPHVAPAGGGGGGPYWCGFLVMAPWRTYLNYGDKRLLERCYEDMKAWMGYVERYRVNGLLRRWPDTDYRGWYLGDWLAPVGVDSGNPNSIDLVNNCFISDCLGALCRVARVLGYVDEAKGFAKQKMELNQLIHQTFYDEEKSIYATGSQLDMAYPMLVGVVPENLYGQVKEMMKLRTMEQYRGHIGVGLVGVPILTEWAVQNREVDFMYHLLKQPDYPGYLYMLQHGATTTWEYWSGERSRVHNCYNGVGNWFYQAIGGIKPDAEAAGYKHFFIEPQIPRGVTWANTTKETPYGTVIVNWALSGENLKMHISVPIGATADLRLPGEASECRINGDKREVSEGAVLLKAGTYDIESFFSYGYE